MHDKQTVDVVMLTYNSASQFGDPSVFKNVLKSVIDSIPLNQFIIVDGYSSDETVKIASNYATKIIQDGRGRGKGREVGIKNVETEWFAFVDSDVILGPKWFERISQSIKPDVGAIHGLVFPDKYWKKFCQSMARLRKRNMVEYLLAQQKTAAMTMDILIRTDIVENITIPRDLHVREDQFIRNYIERQGFMYEVSTSAYCWNVPWPKNYYEKGIHDGILSRRYNYINGYTVIRKAALSIPKSICNILMTQDWISSKNHMIWNIFWLYGYIKEAIE